MSWLRGAPRQVYEVHGEDERFGEEGVCAGADATQQIDASVEGTSSGRVVGPALLITVTLGAAAVVLLHVPHAPAVPKSVAERHASSGARRRAFPDAPATAPPEVHQPRYSRRHAPASAPPPARPHRRRRRIARGHDEPPKNVAAEPLRDHTSVAAARAGGEFDFER